MTFLRIFNDSVKGPLLCRISKPLSEILIACRHQPRSHVSESLVLYA